MKLVYQRACTVITWLGEELASDAEGLDLAKKLNGYLYEHLKLDTYSPNFDPIDLDAAGLPQADDTAWSSLMLLLERPWFRRVWIVQEFIFGVQCTMWCGGLEFKPDLLLRTARLLGMQRDMLMIITAQDIDKPI